MKLQKKFYKGDFKRFLISPYQKDNRYNNLWDILLQERTKKMKLASLNEA